jgi:hypothetical protein
VGKVDTSNKFLGWLWNVGVLYGNVCVDTFVDGASMRLPASWFRMNAVVSKLR